VLGRIRGPLAKQIAVMIVSLSFPILHKLMLREGAEQHSGQSRVSQWTRETEAPVEGVAMGVLRERETQGLTLLLRVMTGVLGQIAELTLYTAKPAAVVLRRLAALPQPLMLVTEEMGLKI
jgi:hypothetical protein